MGKHKLIFAYKDIKELYVNHATMIIYIFNLPSFNVVNVNKI